MLSGSAWAGRRDRAFASVEYPQQRRVAEWTDDGIGRLAEWDHKRARRRAEFAARIPVMAAQVASEISAAVAAEVKAAVAAAIDAAFARHHEADGATDAMDHPRASSATSSPSELHAPAVALVACTSSSAETASVASERVMSIQTAGTADSISAAVGAASIRNNSEPALATPITCSTDFPDRENGAIGTMTSPSASLTSVIPSVSALQEDTLARGNPSMHNTMGPTTPTSAATKPATSATLNFDLIMSPPTAKSMVCHKPVPDALVVVLTQATLDITDSSGSGPLVSMLMPLHKLQNANTAGTHEDEQLLACSSVERPLVLVAARNMADDHTIASKHEVALPLKLLELTPVETKKQNVSPLLPQVTQGMVSQDAYMNQCKAKISDMCSGLGYHTTNSISRNLVVSRAVILDAYVKKLTGDSFGDSDHYKQPSWLEHSLIMNELMARQALALHTSESGITTNVLSTGCYQLHHRQKVQTKHTLLINFSQASNLQNMELGAQKGQYSSRIILMSEGAIRYGPLLESWPQPVPTRNGFSHDHGSEKFQWEIAWLIDLDYIAIDNKLRLPVQWDPSLWRSVELVHKWMVSVSFSLVELQPWTSRKIFLLVPKVLRIASESCHGIMMLGKVIGDSQLIGRMQVRQVYWSLPCLQVYWSQFLLELVLASYLQTLGSSCLTSDHDQREPALMHWKFLWFHSVRHSWFPVCPEGKDSLYGYAAAEIQWEIAWTTTIVAYSIYHGMHLHITWECSSVICYLEIWIKCSTTSSMNELHLHWDTGGFIRHQLGVKPWPSPCRSPFNSSLLESQMEHDMQASWMDRIVLKNDNFCSDLVYFGEIPDHCHIRLMLWKTIEQELILVGGNEFKYPALMTWQVYFRGSGSFSWQLPCICKLCSVWLFSHPGDIAQCCYQLRQWQIAWSLCYAPLQPWVSYCTPGSFIFVHYRGVRLEAFVWNLSLQGNPYCIQQGDAYHVGFQRPSASFPWICCCKISWEAFFEHSLRPGWCCVVAA